MAKLSAHGDEVARLDITRTVPDAEYRIVYSFRSDGHVLRNLNNGGWKLYKKLTKDGNDITRRMVKVAHSFAADAEARGNDTTIDDFQCSA
jgi:hypothetical protein